MERKKRRQPVAGRVDRRGARVCAPAARQKRRDATEDESVNGRRQPTACRAA